MSLVMLLGVGSLLLLSLAISTGLGAVERLLGKKAPQPVHLGQAADLLLSFGLTIMLFAMILKYLPDIEIR